MTSLSGVYAGVFLFGEGGVSSRFFFFFGGGAGLSIAVRFFLGFFGEGGLPLPFGAGGSA